MGAHSSVTRTSRLAAWLMRTTIWAMLGFCGALLLVVTVPRAFGYHSFVVRSGSMAPVIDTGDVIVDRMVSPEHVRVGDTVTFRDPADNTRLITHRVRGIQIRGDKVSFITMGVANNTPERWQVPIKGHIGLATFRVPRLGWAFSVIGTSVGRIVFIVLPVVVLGAMALISIWRPSRDALAIQS